MQLPNEAEIKDELQKRMLGPWNNNGSVNNQISVIIDKSNIEENGEISYRVDGQANHDLGEPNQHQSSNASIKVS